MAHKGKIYPIQQLARYQAVQPDINSNFWPAKAYVMTIPGWQGTFAGGMPDGPYPMDFDSTLAGQRTTAWRFRTLLGTHAVEIRLELSILMTGLATMWEVLVRVDGVDQITDAIVFPGSDWTGEILFGWTDIGLDLTPLGRLEWAYQPY